MSNSDKMTLRINFCDYESDVNGGKHFIDHVVKLLGDSYIPVLCDDPDFLFCFNFGYNVLRYKNCVKILLYTENIFPDFNCYDYAIGFHNLNFGDRHLYIPYYSSFLQHFSGEKVKHASLQENSEPDKLYLNRMFCNFVYSNEVRGSGSKLRKDFCKKLMEYKHVDCPGKVLNNMKGPINDRFDEDWAGGKIDFLRNYKFTIAFENSRQSGYTTEKLYQPFMANSVPIYWGNPDVFIDFNTDAFINCNDFDNDFDAVIDRVIELDNDDEKYLRMLRTNPLNKRTMRINENYNEKIKVFLANIFAKGNKPHYSEFADGEWQRSVTARCFKDLKTIDTMENMHRSVLTGGFSGMRTQEEHRKLFELAGMGEVKLVTFGLTDPGVIARGFEFVNERTVSANFDNDKSKWGSVILGTVMTLNPEKLTEFIAENSVEHIIIMAEADREISFQLDLLKVKYYSWRRLYVEAKANMFK